MKDAGMRIRIEPDLRDAFIKACREDETSAAQVLRCFMRGYLERNAYGRQISLDLHSSTQKPVATKLGRRSK